MNNPLSFLNTEITISCHPSKEEKNKVITVTRNAGYYYVYLDVIDNNKIIHREYMAKFFTEGAALHFAKRMNKNNCNSN